MKGPSADLKDEIVINGEKKIVREDEEIRKIV